MIFAPLVAATLALGTPLASDTFISIMRERLIAESPFIRALGVNPRDFVFRLDYLSGKLAQAGNTPSEREELAREMQLELKLDAELLVNLCPYFDAVAGFDESWYNSDPKAPPDPVALYVPPRQPQPYAVVVLLHGRGQTETDVLSQGVFRHMADLRHAILVAPWGTGGALWGDAAAREIANILAELEGGLPIDPSRIYVAGVGLGGEGAFGVAARYANIFRGVLSIDGSLGAGDAFAVSHELRDRDVYLVSNDPVVYDVLASACVPVSRYDAQAAALSPDAQSDQVEEAWNDMFDGTVRNGSAREC